MTRDKPIDQATQETQPKKGEPVEIPVPSKDQIMGDFEKIATSPKTKKVKNRTDADDADV